MVGYDHSRKFRNNQAKFVALSNRNRADTDRVRQITEANTDPDRIRRLANSRYNIAHSRDLNASRVNKVSSQYCNIDRENASYDKAFKQSVLALKYKQIREKSLSQQEESAAIDFLSDAKISLKKAYAKKNYDLLPILNDYYTGDTGMFFNKQCIHFFAQNTVALQTILLYTAVVPQLLTDVRVVIKGMQNGGAATVLHYAIGKVRNGYPVTAFQMSFPAVNAEVEGVRPEKYCVFFGTYAPQGVGPQSLSRDRSSTIQSGSQKVSSYWTMDDGDAIYFQCNTFPYNVSGLLCFDIKTGNNETIATDQDPVNDS